MQRSPLHFAYTLQYFNKAIRLLIRAIYLEQLKLNAALSATENDRAVYQTEDKS